ncbi:MAG: DUF4253 domain-containing protein [Chloroflexota bacterium]
MAQRQKLTALFSEHHLQIAALKVLWKNGKKTTYYFKMSGSEALIIWEQLRSLVEVSGYWPVLLGTVLDMRILKESIPRHDEPKSVYGEGFVMHSPLSTETFAHVSSAAGLAWLERERQERLNDEGPFPRSDWPSNVTSFNKISSIYDYKTNEPYPELFMALVPSQECWLVPLYLSFGGWNDCPPPDVHVNLFKYWYDTYGAEVVALTHDTVEMQVSSPPTSPEIAIKLAEEQFLYCSDMDYDGTVDDLAAQLINASVWLFWWD